jgi:putative phosphoribosyl transferase
MNDESARLVEIPADGVLLQAMLALPENAQGVVAFAHGSGSGRMSPRNNFVAETLRHRGLGTLLVDLLTQREDAIHATRFDIALLTQRLAAAVAWLESEAGNSVPIGLFGASTGAAAALQVAASSPARIGAVVSRGGRPDLAGVMALHAVVAPTLLIVGGADLVVLDLNNAAFAELRCKKRIDVVPGATHLFEEPGTLGQVAMLAGDWFAQHLTANATMPIR